MLSRVSSFIASSYELVSRYLCKFDASRWICESLGLVPLPKSVDQQTVPEHLRSALVEIVYPQKGNLEPGLIFISISLLFSIAFSVLFCFLANKTIEQRLNAKQSEASEHEDKSVKKKDGPRSSKDFEVQSHDVAVQQSDFPTQVGDVRSESSADMTMNDILLHLLTTIKRTVCFNELLELLEVKSFTEIAPGTEFMLDCKERKLRLVLTAMEFIEDYTEQLMFFQKLKINDHTLDNSIRLHCPQVKEIVVVIDSLDKLTTRKQTDGTTKQFIALVSPHENEIALDELLDVNDFTTVLEQAAFTLALLKRQKMLDHLTDMFISAVPWFDSVVEFQSGETKIAIKSYGIKIKYSPPVFQMGISLFEFQHRVEGTLNKLKELDQLTDRDLRYFIRILRSLDTERISIEQLAEWRTEYCDNDGKNKGDNSLSQIKHPIIG